ncbi:MAG: hypothetical protein IRY83_06990 [Chloroflexi bacterium]|nr:hypothetical protein [Chloroflexota bacterium]
MRQSMTAPWSSARPVILLCLAFVVGAGIGWMISRPFAGGSGRVTDRDYVAVVALLFQIDHNQEVARERLALLGSPSALVQQALDEARAGRLRNPSDRTAIEALARALLPTVVPTASTSTAGRPATAARASGAGVSLVGPIAVFLFAFALGAIVLLRTAGVSLRSSGPVPGLRREPLDSNRGFHRPSATLRTGPSFERPRPADEVDTRSDGEVSREEEEIRNSTAGVSPILPRAVNPAGVSRSRDAGLHPSRIARFESCYRLGDDPYDEIHPITDPTTGALMAACGLSSALSLAASSPGRYYAFTAWLQDYTGGEQFLRAAGLVTPWAARAAATSIDEWMRHGQVDVLLPVERGAVAELVTDHLKATVTVVDAAFGDAEQSAGAYFRELIVRFEIHPVTTADRGTAAWSAPRAGR